MQRRLEFIALSDYSRFLLSGKVLELTIEHSKKFEINQFNGDNKATVKELGNLKNEITIKLLKVSCCKDPEINIKAVCKELVNHHYDDLSKSFFVENILQLSAQCSHAIRQSLSSYTKSVQETLSIIDEIEILFLRFNTECLIALDENTRAKQVNYERMIAEVKDYAIFTLNEYGIIQNWNEGAKKIKGYESEEVIGKSFRIFYRKKDLDEKLPEQLLSIARVKGKASHEGWRVRKDGELFWGSIVITAIHDDQGDIIGFTKVTRDLTEKKSAETGSFSIQNKLKNIITNCSGLMTSLIHLFM